MIEKYEFSMQNSRRVAESELQALRDSEPSHDVISTMLDRWIQTAGLEEKDVFSPNDHRLTNGCYDFYKEITTEQLGHFLEIDQYVQDIVDDPSHTIVFGVDEKYEHLVEYITEAADKLFQP